jgi:uncharacterized membrane protein YkgB
MKFVSVSEISALGKWVVSAVIAFGALLQIPQFSAPVFMAAKLHPHIAAIVATLTTLSALMSNPQVQKILHINIQPGDKLAAKDVEMDAQGVITAASATLTAAPKPPQV